MDLCRFTSQMDLSRSTSLYSILVQLMLLLDHAAPGNFGRHSRDRGLASKTPKVGATQQHDDGIPGPRDDGQPLEPVEEGLAPEGAGTPHGGSWHQDHGGFDPSPHHPTVQVLYDI